MAGLVESVYEAGKESWEATMKVRNAQIKLAATASINTLATTLAVNGQVSRSDFDAKFANTASSGMVNDMIKGLGGEIFGSNTSLTTDQFRINTKQVFDNKLDALSNGVSPIGKAANALAKALAQGVDKQIIEKAVPSIPQAQTPVPSPHGLSSSVPANNLPPRHGLSAPKAQATPAPK